MQTLSESQVWQTLAQIPDPEIPVINIVEMGIVRQVSLAPGRVEVSMTPTFSGCPALHVIRDNIQKAVEGLGVQATVHTVLAPAWSTDWITPEAKEKLRVYGIAPPKPATAVSLIQLDLEPVRCPRCGSLNTSIKNTFGPTLCKAIHVCNDCREPFESFKPL